MKNPTIEKGDWVASDDHIGKVREVHDDDTLDIVLYARSGQKIGRESPDMGGPTGFEPCCPGYLWRPIYEPKFPLRRYAYVNEVVTFIESTHSQFNSGEKP